MNQNELIEEVAKKAKLPKSTVKQIVLLLKTEIIINILNKTPVKLMNLGTLRVITRKTRRGRNPQTGQKMTIPKHLGISFIPSTSLKKELNKNYSQKEPR